MKKSFGGKLFNAFNYGFMGLLMLIMLFPLWNVFITSIVTPGEYYSSALILWPKKVTLQWYGFIFGARGEIVDAMLVTVFVTLAGSLYSMLITTMLAYGLTKKNLPGRNFFITLITITMFFGGGLIPYYLLIRNLGMMDTLWVLFIPSAVNTWNFIVIKSFFNQLPQELEESAKIDGANEVFIFFRIILPISLPMLATFVLFYGVGYWNLWWPSNLFIQTSSKRTLQHLLREMIVNNQRPAALDTMSRMQGMEQYNLFDEGVKMATVVVATVPILIVYPFLQKYFTQGMIVGSIKG